MRSCVAAGGRDREEFGKYLGCDVGSLSGSARTLEGEGWANDRPCPSPSLVALVRSVLLALPLETHQQGIPRDQGAFIRARRLVLRTAGCETKSSFFKSLVSVYAWWVKGTVMVMVLLS